MVAMTEEGPGSLPSCFLMNPGLIAESSSASLSPGQTRHSVSKGRSSLGTFLHSLGSFTYMTSALGGLLHVVECKVCKVLQPQSGRAPKKENIGRSHMCVVPCFVFSLHVTPLMKSGLYSSVKATQGFSTSVHSCWLPTCDEISLGITMTCKYLFLMVA